MYMIKYNCIRADVFLFCLLSPSVLNGSIIPSPDDAEHTVELLLGDGYFLGCSPFDEQLGTHIHNGKEGKGVKIVQCFLFV